MVGVKRKTKTKIERKGRFGRFKARKAFRMVFVKAPGGKTKVQFKKRKPGKAKCASCGAQLSGTARERPYKMKNMPKTKKRPTRAFGGYLCTKCARKVIIKEARKK